MSADLGALDLVQAVLRRRVFAGARCVDATAGRGRDTALLCELAGPGGRVWAFDIQQEAIDSTTALLRERNLQAQVIRDCHSNMAAYLPADGVDCIVFNFGWLPGGDHAIGTQLQTSIAALRAGLELLRPGGFISLCVYYGRDSGFAERDALLEFLPGIDSRQYTVLLTQFVNRPNNPPFPAWIIKNE